jgi:cyclin-dependent kinase regulatory subunit CKS1
VLRILKDAEWRKIGITQSLGWEHYEVHGESWPCQESSAEDRRLINDIFFIAPEPHILLFRREKDFQEKVSRGLSWEKKQSH